ncbi:unnamed protein product [Somion occarium]|uniref:F-box domain-containing protein n=1 Tax=Somion occarium TaxID=3059160 RepID=A0ABP1DF13_9APHY
MPGVPTLPIELIIQILNILDYKGLLKCRQICKQWDLLIQGDTSLIYKVHLAVNGMEDSNSSSMNVVERLRTLKEHGDDWGKLRFTQDEIVDMNTPANCVWELQGGVLTQARDERTLVFTQIPSQLRHIQKRTWTLDNLDVVVADYCIDPSQDLLVIAGERADGSAPANIHLRTLSSGDTHPRASNVILAYGHDYIGHSHNIRISGDHVAICWSGKLLSIWNWKSGVLQMALKGHHLTFAFLSDDHVLIPRYHETRVDLIAINFRLASSTLTAVDDIEYDCAFGLPPVNPHSQDINVSMRYGPAVPNASRLAPFHISQEDFLLVVYLTGVTSRWRVGLDRFMIPASTLLRHLEALPSHTDDRFRIDWDEWGPTGCQVSPLCPGYSNIWIRNVYGTRFVELEDKNTDESGCIRLFFADFNQVAARKGTVEGQPLQTAVHITEAVSSDLFQGPVTTSLPFRSRTCTLSSKTEERYEGVMVSEDAIVLVRYTRNFRTQFRILSI